jgi:hypothetical protein
MATGESYYERIRGSTNPEAYTSAAPGGPSTRHHSNGRLVSLEMRQLWYSLV